LIQGALGAFSAHFQGFESALAIKEHSFSYIIEETKGVFLAAKEDYEGGYIFNLKAALTGEIFSDFIATAQAALDDGYKDVAAVLACAALEDSTHWRIIFVTRFVFRIRPWPYPKLTISRRNEYGRS
jgi:hypothetical protein